MTKPISDRKQAAARKAKRDYMRRYRQRPEVRERLLAEQRTYDAFNRDKNRARWNAHNKSPKRRRARQDWYSKNRARILAANKTKRDYVVAFGNPPRGYVIELARMKKSLRTGKDEYAQLRNRLAASRARAVASRKSNPANDKRKEEFKVTREYYRLFGPLSGVPDVRLMKRSLKTGSDELAETRQRQAAIVASWAEREAERDAERRAKPFSADDEAYITWAIKSRQLYDGACDLRWEDYVAFRKVHKCDRLTANDLRYAGQWTSCAVVQK